MIKRREFISGFSVSTSSLFMGSKFLDKNYNTNKLEKNLINDINIIGHRGYSAKYQDNSDKSIKKALNNDIKGVEIDIRKTRDKIVLNHDPFVISKNKGYINISNYELDEINSYNLLSNNIITLKKAIEIIKSYNAKVYLDLKEPEYIDDIINIVKKHDYLHNSIFIAWNASDLKSAINIEKCETGLISLTPNYNIVNEAVKNNIDSVIPHYINNPINFRKYCDENNIKCGYWFISDLKSDFKSSFYSEPDFIITNEPKQAINFRNNV